MSDAVIGFIGAIIGGLLVMAGSLLGQLLVDWLARRREKRAAINEAYTLVGALPTMRETYETKLKSKDLSDAELAKMLGYLRKQKEIDAEDRRRILDR